MVGGAGVLFDDAASTAVGVEDAAKATAVKAVLTASLVIVRMLGNIAVRSFVRSFVRSLVRSSARLLVCSLCAPCRACGGPVRGVVAVALYEYVRTPYSSTVLETVHVEMWRAGRAILVLARARCRRRAGARPRAGYSGHRKTE